MTVIDGYEIHRASQDLLASKVCDTEGCDTSTRTRFDGVWTCSTHHPMWTRVTGGAHSHLYLPILDDGGWVETDPQHRANVPTVVGVE